MALRNILLVLALSAGCLAAPALNTTGNGFKSTAVQPRIVGGSEVDQPIYYQVSIRIQTDESSLEPKLLRHICGGSLISLQFVLTAASCLNDENVHFLKLGRVYVVAGTTQLLFDKSTTFLSLVTHFVEHPNYDPRKHHNNIAVLKIADSIPTNIPDVGLALMRDKPSTTGERCTISGWGTVAYQDNSLSQTLRTGTVLLIDRNTCSRKYAGKLPELSPNMVCAGEDNGSVDTCQGDDGGPLVCDKELTGVISWGHCGAPGVPGVYTEVAPYRTFISNAMRYLQQPPPNRPSTKGSTQHATEPTVPTFPTIAAAPRPPSQPTTPSSAFRSTIDILLFTFTVIFTAMFVRQS